jgi:hypothetical protein
MPAPEAKLAVNIIQPVLTANAVSARVFPPDAPKRLASAVAAMREATMSDETRLSYLRIALVVFGVIFVLGVYPLTMIWPSG